MIVYFLGWAALVFAFITVNWNSYGAINILCKLTFAASTIAAIVLLLMQLGYVVKA